MDELETICPICHGTGGSESRYEIWRCHNCRGAGYIPTEFGKKVLDLMRHNFQPMYEDMRDELGRTQPDKHAKED